MQPLQIPIAFEFLRHSARYKILAGGRGPAKSNSMIRQAIINSETECELFLFLREIQKTIKDSSYRLICNIIRSSGRSDNFRILENRIICRSTGSELIFHGLRDLRAADALRSIEGVKYCIIDEGQNISGESWDVLCPTIRMSGSEIWAALNPRFEDDIIFETFFDLTDGKVVPKKIIEICSNCIFFKTIPVLGERPSKAFCGKHNRDSADNFTCSDFYSKTQAKFVSWRDNPWFTQENYDLMQADRLLSESKYRHKWEGSLKVAGGDLISRDWFARYDPYDQRSYLIRFISADTAFSKATTADWSVLGLWGMTRDSLDLLDVERARWDYPELLAAIKGFYDKHTNDAADIVNGVGPMGDMLIEKKASGQSLIQSLEHEGFRPIKYDPGDQDKVSRVNSATPSIKWGRVRIPPDEYAPWVKPFVDECAAFRSDMKHRHDDQVDMMTQAEYTWRQTIG